MRYLIVFGVFILISWKAFSLGDTSRLPPNSKPMTNTVSTLNQVGTEKREKTPIDQQDLQEQQFQEDRLREEREWRELKKIEDANLNEINTPK